MNLSLTEIWLVSLLIITSILVLVVTLQLSTVLKKLTQDPNQVDEEENLSWWDKFKGLKPIEKEGEIAMEHQYDGIVELDNPTPPWFMYLFYITIIFAGIYLFYYHLSPNSSLSQDEEYTTEVTIAEKAKEEYMKKFANSVNEDNAKALTGKAELEEGAKVYATNCVACHGDKGQGGVGPNLTDNYWIHGGGIKNVFHTITQGVPEKGMIAWNKTLNPIQVQKVASYILSLKGTNPPGAKEPQGEEVK